jgi:hypothetical protein
MGALKRNTHRGRSVSIEPRLEEGHEAVIVERVQGDATQQHVSRPRSVVPPGLVVALAVSYSLLGDVLLLERG